MSPLVGPPHAEAAVYLQRVFDAQPAARERVEVVLDLPELYRNLVLLELAELAPAALLRAMETVVALGCLACSHARHKPGDCLVATISADGRGYCTCGSAVGR